MNFSNSCDYCAFQDDHSTKANYGEVGDLNPNTLPSLQFAFVSLFFSVCVEGVFFVC